MLAIIKNTSVALTIGLAELTAQARAMQEYTFHVFEAFTAATLIYFALNVIVVQLSRMIERRTANKV
jgi:glutamate/aspartate transport system permease protein